MNKTSDISPRTELFAVKALLKVLQPMLVTQRFAQTDQQPKKNSTTRKWRRYKPLAVTTAPLAEGVTPESQKLEHEDVTAVLKQYGGVCEITDVVQDVVDDPVLKVMSQRLGEQAAQTIELLTIEKLKSGSNVYYASGETSRANVAAKISRGDLRRVVRGLDRGLAKPITSIIKPSAKISTSGVEAAYFAMGHTDLEPDIRDITGFKTVVEYSNPSQAISGEVGAVERVRFILTQNFTPWEAVGASGSTMLTGGVSGTGNADVYPIIIVGRDAYAAVRLQGHGSFKMYVMNPGVARGGDTLGQRGSIGWKTWYTSAILTENYMARLEVACTADPS
jgi:N4-gp56 family major capsid protein